MTSAARVTSPDRAVTVEPTAALVHGDTVGALVWVVEPATSLRDLVGDSWASSPVDRMAEMLRRSGTSIGLVTDGRWWALVSAAPTTMTASGIVDAQTWVEEPATRNAFAALLSLQRLVGGVPGDRLPALFARRDRWQQRRAALVERGLSLAYERTGDESRYGPLMRGAESVRSRRDAVAEAPFVVPNSMREVQPEINLLVSPVKERLFVVPPPGAPVWQAQGSDEADGDD